LNRLNFKNISLTIIATKHPLNLLEFLRKHFGLSLIQSGIYRVEHTAIPTQIVISNELSESENLWLTSLKNDLAANQLKQVTTEIASYEYDAAVNAYLDVVIGTNFQTYQKLMETPNMKTLTQHLREMGYIDQLFAKEREQWLAERDQLLAKERAERAKERAKERQLLAKEQTKRQADKIETASKLKLCGVDYEIIAKATGLSLQEVKRLK
jgi:hypothetical protein